MARKRDGVVPIGEALATRPRASHQGREMTRRLWTLQRNNVLPTTLTGLAIGLALFAFTLPATAQLVEQPDKYLILATNRTGTMEDELNEVPPEYELVAMTVFKSTFGGDQAARHSRSRDRGGMTKSHAT